MLKNNSYISTYRSIFNDFDKEFMIPSYKESIQLDRGSGFFTIKSLAMSFEGLSDFASRGGKIRLVCNPQLTQEDIAIIDWSTSNSITSGIQSVLLKAISSTYDLPEEYLHALDIICNMLSEGLLEIKIAFMKRGIYHEKFGIFTDEEGNKVYYNGSANETAAAKTDNFESFRVSATWYGVQDEISITNESTYFRFLWNNEISDKISVMDFPEAVKENLFAAYKKSDSLYEALNAFVLKENEEIPYGKKTLYPYQEEAIEEFVKNGFSHFYEMATGTGKTFTAVKTIQRLSKIIEKPLFTIICVPQIDLQIQWEHALLQENIGNVYQLGGMNPNAESTFSTARISYFASNESVVCVATYDTFFSKIHDKCNRIKDLFFIVDEAHNLTPQQMKKIPDNIKYKLGLSATIQRYSKVETDKIISYFTKDIVKPYYYGIEDAINNGFLSKYEYHPIYTRLEQDKFEIYQAKTKSIAQEINKDEPDYDKINKLCRERSLLVKQSNSKVEKLRKMVGDYDFRNSVVYCGQGKNGEDELIIDSVTEILYHSNLKVAQFTSKTQDRSAVLREFEKGICDTLVAIKCFDEGVDVPKLDKIYIMASDTALRQTVQRRGRVLRKCKETNKQIAYIYDMVVLPPDGYFNELGVESLVVNELRRVYEYNRLAENKAEIVKDINSFVYQYNIKEDNIYGKSESDRENIRREEFL